MGLSSIFVGRKFYSLIKRSYTRDKIKSFYRTDKLYP